MKTSYEGVWHNSDANYKNYALISKCGKYRWFFGSKTDFVGPEKRMIFKMINPSTASHESDDPTVKSCRRIAEKNNCTDFCILNFYPLRTPNVSDLDEWFAKTNIQEAFDVTGVSSMLVSMSIASAKENPKEIIFVVACGKFGKAKGLKEKFSAFLNKTEDTPIFCLGQNQDGSPMHPLFKAANTPLVSFNRGRVI